MVEDWSVLGLECWRIGMLEDLECWRDWSVGGIGTLEGLECWSSATPHHLSTYLV